MDYFNSLPLDIQLYIFSRVPAESLVNDSKLVCKTWNDLVLHPSLSRLHLHHINHDDSNKLGFLASTGCVGTQKFKYFEYNQNQESTTPIGKIRRVNLKTPSHDFSSSEIVGSCNGLICLLDGRRSLRICNLITREQVMLPEIQFSDTQNYSRWTTGFGYVPSTDEYKIVGIQTYYSPHKNAEVHIYTLGSGTGWRNLGKFNIDFGENLPLQCVFSNGALYWIGQNSKMIITFDLDEEKFCENLSAPPLPRKGNQIINGTLGVLDGFLYFYVWLDEEDNRCDIWLLENKKRGDLHSLGWIWTKMFKLEDMSLVTYTKTGGILTYGWDYYLKIYDPKTCVSRELVDFKELIREIFPHKNTLVSLKQLGEEGTEIMESIEIDKIESCDSPLEHLDPEEVEALDRVSKKIRR